jgi:aminoacyl tRNA synthase complex-interacting multifunctional protein 1
MATASAPSSSLLSLLYRSYPAVIPADATELDLFHATPKIFPDIIYSEAEKADIKQWINKINGLAAALAKNDNKVITEVLGELNSHLANRTTLLGGKPSVADVSAYAVIAPLVE